MIVHAEASQWLERKKGGQKRVPELLITVFADGRQKGGMKNSKQGGSESDLGSTSIHTHDCLQSAGQSWTCGPRPRRTPCQELPLSLAAWWAAALFQPHGSDGTVHIICTVQRQRQSRIFNQFCNLECGLFFFPIANSQATSSSEPGLFPLKMTSL